MKNTTTWKRVAMIVCLVLLTTACGQKGDLYLPEGSALINWMG